MDDELTHYGVKGMRWGVRRNLRKRNASERQEWINSKEAKWKQKIDENPQINKILRWPDFGEDDMEETDAAPITHHGVKGMKWGVRKDRSKGGSGKSGGNSNGGPSNAQNGQKHGVKDTTETTGVKRPSRFMSDKELQSAINRIRLEQEYAKLTAKPPNKGKQILMKALENGGQQVANKLVASLMTTALVKAGVPAEMLGGKGDGGSNKKSKKDDSDEDELYVPSPKKNKPKSKPKKDKSEVIDPEPQKSEPGREIDMPRTIDSTAQDAKPKYRQQKPQQRKPRPKGRQR